MSTLVHAPSHGLASGDTFTFGDVLPPDTGIVEGQVYFILAADLGLDDFRFSETLGGSEVALAADITEAVISPAPAYDLVGSPTPVTQVANTVYAGPASGADAVPTFRPLVSADLSGVSVTAAVVWNEVPSGTVNGVNAVFTIASAPAPPGGLMLFRNGLLMSAGSGSDFTLSGATITFEAGNLPQTGDVLRATYPI